MLIQLLQDAAEVNPDLPLLLTDEGKTTYRQCVNRSLLLARGLHQRSLSRIACVMTRTEDLVALLAGSSAIGCEACTYPANLDDAGIDELAASFGHDAIVTDRELNLSVGTPVPIMSLTGKAELPATPAEAPLLILTTGTTGRPKGARHDWSRLVEAARRRTTFPSERWLLAYNLNQFAGIQVLLHVLASRATLVVPKSRLPREAIEVMRCHAVTHASGTPTFWRFVLALLDERTARDLHLEQVTLGGEPVTAQVLDDLRRRFPDVRLSHVYASTEFGSSISVRDGRPGLPVSVLSRGDDADIQLRIVDGELYVRSRVGMLGYQGEADLPNGEWRPTADLVEARDDRVYFIGRTAETINVGGVKVHPLQVEELIGTVDGVQWAQVYGRKNPMTGQIVAVDVVAEAGADRVELEEVIRSVCASLPYAAQPRRIRFVDEIKINEHKIARRSE